MFNKWDKADKVITIRISTDEYNALSKQVEKINLLKFRHQKKLSEHIRDILRNYLNRNYKEDL